MMKGGLRRTKLSIAKEQWRNAFVQFSLRNKRETNGMLLKIFEEKGG